MLKVITLTATLALSATVAAQEAGNVKVACKSAQDTWGGRLLLVMTVFIRQVRKKKINQKEGSYLKISTKKEYKKIK